MQGNCRIKTAGWWNAIREALIIHRKQNKTIEDVDKLGIKTFFCSNVCAAYKKSVYKELGGFVPRAIFNEDMILAGTMIKAGYGIAYAADAKVIHSHNYSGRQQFHRILILQFRRKIIRRFLLGCHPRARESAL